MPALPLFRWRSDALAETVSALAGTVSRLQEELTEAKAERMTLAQSPAATAANRASILSGGAMREATVLYDAWRSVVWLAGPIDTICRRVISGGWGLRPTVKGASQTEWNKLNSFFSRVNDDEDLNELLLLALRGKYIFGAGQWEIVEAAGVPFQLYLADPISVQPDYDDKGVIKQYIQRSNSGEKPIELKPSQILRFPERGPRGETLSPINLLINSAVLYSRMITWGQKFFENGARPSLVLELAENSNETTAARHVAWVEENIAGTENAKNIPVVWGGAKLTNPGGQSTIDLDFLNGLKYVREEFLTILGVPASAANIADNGNRLSDQGDSVDKQFKYNVIDPNRRLFEEKVNWRLVKQGFGITDWEFCIHEADYRSDTLIVDTIVKQVHEGLLNRDEARSQMGTGEKLPGGGGNIASISLSREVVPVSDLAAIHGSQFIQAQQQAMSQGLDPHAKPRALAQQSPAVPGAPPIPEPVQQTVAPIPATEDLGRWQRKALRAFREGKAQVVFTSSAIPDDVHERTASCLPLCASEDEIRAVFDHAFGHARMLSEQAPGQAEIDDAVADLTAQLDGMMSHWLR